MGPSVNDESALFQYQAEIRTAAAVSRVYHDMMEAGVTYGYFTTGEAIVFLRLDRNDPSILYYHLVEPAADFEKHKHSAFYYTAIGPVLGFTLRAIRSHLRASKPKKAASASAEGAEQM